MRRFPSAALPPRIAPRRPVHGRVLGLWTEDGGHARAQESDRPDR